MPLKLIILNGGWVMNSEKKPGVTFFKLFVKLVLMLVIISVASCSEGLFSHDETNGTETRSLPAFSKIQVNSIVDIRLVKDSVFSVKLDGDPGNFNQIFTEVVNDTLRINDHNTRTWVPDYVRTSLEIHFTDLQKIMLWAPCDLTNTDTLQLNSLIIWALGNTTRTNLTIKMNSFYLVTGSNDFGYYILNGVATTTNLWPRGSAIIHAENLDNEYLKVTSNTIADTRVYAPGKLTVAITSTGNVLYSGNPSSIEMLDESGKGKLINVDK